MENREEKYTGIGYAMFQKREERLNGVVRTIVKLIDIKKEFADAINIIRNRISTFKHDINSYYIVSYDYDKDFPERIKEYQLTKML